MVDLVEADVALSTSGQLIISDVDSAATFEVQTDYVGTYGVFNIDVNGAWTYVETSAHDAFVAGTTYTDTFNVVSTDGAASSVTVNILGTIDLAVLSADVVALDETDAVLSTAGLLTIADVDSVETFVAQTASAGTYGVFNLGTCLLYTSPSPRD